MITGRIIQPVIVVLLFAVLADSKPMDSKNLLYSQPGVAIFIRPGDTPLEEIDAGLAEAFNFNALKHGKVVFGRDINEILDEKRKNPSFMLNSVELGQGESYALKKKKIGRKIRVEKVAESSHIQRIPRPASVETL